MCPSKAIRTTKVIHVGTSITFSNALVPLCSYWCLSHATTINMDSVACLNEVSVNMMSYSPRQLTAYS